MPGDNRVACGTVSTVAKGLPVQLGASQELLEQVTLGGGK